jgi:hypothetical protein
VTKRSPNAHYQPPLLLLRSIFRIVRTFARQLLIHCFFKSHNLLSFLPSTKHNEAILSLFSTLNSSARHLRSPGDQYCLPSSISVSCLSRRYGFSFPVASTPRRRRMTSPQQQVQQGISFPKIHSQMTYFAISSWVSPKEVQMGRRLCAAF